MKCGQQLVFVIILVLLVSVAGCKKSGENAATPQKPAIGPQVPPGVTPKITPPKGAPAGAGVPGSSKTMSGDDVQKMSTQKAGNAGQ